MSLVFDKDWSGSWSWLSLCRHLAVAIPTCGHWSYLRHLSLPFALANSPERRRTPTVLPSNGWGMCSGRCLQSASSNDESVHIDRSDCWQLSLASVSELANGVLVFIPMLFVVRDCKRQ